MKTAVWYTSTFFVIFVYLYVYLVQYIRGAEIRPVQPPPPYARRIGLDPWAGLGAAGQSPGPPPPTVYRDYLASASAQHPQQVHPVVHQPHQPSVAARAPAPPSLDFAYHNYDQMTDWLKQFTAAYPNLTALYSIGKSVQGAFTQTKRQKHNVRRTPSKKRPPFPTTAKRLTNDSRPLLTAVYLSYKDHRG